MRTSTFIVPLLAAALLAGCGDDAKEQSKARSNTAQHNPQTPAGYRVRLVAEDGFSIALPRRWQVIAQQDLSASTGAISTLSRLYPKLAPALGALAEPDSPVKLVAFDVRRAREAAVPTILSVLVDRAPPGSYEMWSRSVLRAVRSAGARGVRVEARSVRLPAGRALVLTYSKRVGASRATTAHAFLVQAGALFVVTITGGADPPVLLDRIAPTLELFARPAAGVLDPGG